MHRFETKLLSQILRRRDCVTNCSVVVACSGGGDSVALLSCLVALRAKFNIKLKVAHLDHGLRPESKEEALFVAKLCERFDLGLAVCSLDIAHHATSSGMGLEMAARELRWEWLKKEAAKIDATWIATGHTIEDHTETVFVRLTRGSGLGCLSGLPAVQPPRWSPLIECRREELRGYLQSKGIEWREDVTNELGFTSRNRWRKHMELFRCEAPCIDKHLWETHRQATELLDLRDSIVASWKGVRWDISEEGQLWLDTGWKTRDLAWVIEAAFRKMAIPRDSTHIFDLATWAAKKLVRKPKRPWKCGNWSLCPNEHGAYLRFGTPKNQDN